MDVVVLFFLLGLAARIAGSDLRLPEALYEALSIFLLLAIGIKGGVELAGQPLATVGPQALAVIALGILIPLVAFPVLRGAGRMNRYDAGALAAHYGSVSVVTYAVAITFLASRNADYEPYFPVFVVLMEAPAIVVGIVLARAGAPGKPVAWRALAHEVLLGKSIVLLLGGLAIGWIAGPTGIVPVKALFSDLFKGVLALFLLEMGLVAGSRIGDLRRYGLFLVAFGIVMPIVSAAIGIGFATFMGLSPGGTVLLATLAGSASYIAAPAALRIALPEANPGLSIAASLGITFPFNITLGIPLYSQMAGWAAVLGGR
jgi:uncharacterized protein